MRVQRDHCIRCGECCLKSSPTLQTQDLRLIKSEFIQKREIFTIRKGELVRDNIHGRLTLARQEMIKVKEREGEIGGCIFYDESEKACRIYEKRPVQCYALECWDTTALLEVYRGPKPERRDIIEDGVLLRLIEEHEMRCSYGLIEDHVKQIESEGEKAIEKILDILRFDYHLRPFVLGKLGLDPEEMDLFFGRPLIRTITMFGLKVIRESDGTFLLTAIKSSHYVR